MFNRVARFYTATDVTSFGQILEAKYHDFQQFDSILWKVVNMDNFTTSHVSKSLIKSWQQKRIFNSFLKTVQLKKNIIRKKTNGFFKKKYPKPFRYLVLTWGKVQERIKKFLVAWHFWFQFSELNNTFMVGHIVIVNKSTKNKSHVCF